MTTTQACRVVPLVWSTMVSLTLAAASPADVDSALARLALDAGQGKPLYRIGLDSAHSVEISSGSAFRIVDPATGKAAWKPEYSGKVVVVAEGGPTGEVPSVFRIQVGAFSTREAADAERRRMESRFGEPGVVHHHPDRDSWRVRLGAASSRDGLASLVDALRLGGVDGAWIVEEPSEATDSVRLRIVNASFESHATGLRRLAIVPRRKGRLSVAGKPYRGIIELRVSPFGTVRAVNWIELETYLRGVVPKELGPAQWPQIEALKAQSVAARTYAWRNRGQFDDEGFDLCATPRCQVYGGSSAEHPLSDRAVSETRGRILTWEGAPISALYTATCGGHTEDGREIFPEEDAPYLTGVPCRAEAAALEDMRITLDGADADPLVAEDGRDVTRDRALLTASGVLGDLHGADLSAAVLSADLRRWTQSLAALAGRPEPVGEPGEVNDLGRAAASLVHDLAWSERANLLLDDGDVPAVLRDTEAASLPEDQRRALAYLALAGGIHPYPDGRFHIDTPPSAARLLPALTRIGEAYDAFEIESAVIAGTRGKRLRMFRGTSEITLAVAEGARLFAVSGGKSVPESRLALWPGDRVRYRLNGTGRIDFLEVVAPLKGLSDDRSSSVYSWEVRKTRRELETAANRRVAVGRLQDLRVLRRGRSGRVVELEVRGSRGTTVVRGFDIRRLLQLKESLTVIEIQRSAGGELEAVVFAGKGWGHGVGLCQVGAYGMALRGSDHVEILAHYYVGATLDKLDPTAKRANE
jgi:stage II sporulation protein D